MKVDYEGIDYMISIFDVTNIPANESQDTTDRTTVIGKVQYFTDVGIGENVYSTESGKGLS